MSIENPNLLERIMIIEKRLDALENRISYLEKLINRSPSRPFPLPEPNPQPPKPGPMPEPFRF